jgi:hypothetical protein
MKPSQYQQAVLDWIENGQGDAVVNAVPGSGKTTVLLMAAEAIKSPNSLFCAFNKSIQQEIEGKLKKVNSPMKAKTIHSLGLAALNYGTGKKMNLDGYKYSNILDDLLKNHFRDLVKKGIMPSDKAKDWQYLRRVKASFDKIVHFTMMTLTTPSDQIGVEDIITYYGLEFPDYWEDLFPVVAEAMEEGKRMMVEDGLINFDEMVYGPIILDLKPLQFDWIFIDEVQDTSKAQLNLILKFRKKGGRIIAVGDPHQCQPPGTKVRLSDNTEKAIEDLKIGNEVWSYARNSASYVKLNHITAIQKRDYSGELVEISVGDKLSRSTPNHKWLVRWAQKEEGQNTWATYLMKKGNFYRVGISQLFHEGKGYYCFGVASRARQEKADAAWVLGIHSTRREALREEAIISVKYNLPQLRFQACKDDKNLFFNQEDLDYIYSAYPNLQENAVRCLNSYGRDIQYPIWEKEWRSKQGKMSLFETQACNLIPQYMAIPVPPEKIVPTNRLGKSTFQTITDLHREAYNGPVYSLNVEKHHKYISDGLLTCNSIYGFSGADPRSFQNVIDTTGAIELPLSICYRCPTSVIEHSQTVFPGIEPRENAPEGKVRQVSEIDLYKEVQEGDMILCRLNAPLLKTCLDLIARGISAKVRGRDIGKQLVSIIKDVHSGFGGVKNFYAKFPKYLDLYFVDKREKLSNRKNSEILIEALQDKVDAVMVVYESAMDCKNAKDLEQYIETLFSDDRTSVTLSTVHKAKGLENPRVFIIKPEKLPLHFPKMQDWQIFQEQCLHYVAITRAQEELIYVREDHRAEEVERFMSTENGQKGPDLLEEMAIREFEDEMGGG